MRWTESLELEDGIGRKRKPLSRPLCGLKRQNGFLEERTRILKILILGPNSGFGESVVGCVFL